MSKKTDIVSNSIFTVFLGGIGFFSFAHLFWGGPAAFVGLWILLWLAGFGIVAIASDTHERLNQRRDDLNRRQRATQQELAQEQKSLAAFSTELTSISKALESFRASIPA